MDTTGLILEPQPLLFLPGDFLHHVGFEYNFLFPGPGRGQANIDFAKFHKLIKFLPFTFLFVVDLMEGYFLTLSSNTGQSF